MYRRYTESSQLWSTKVDCDILNNRGSSGSFNSQSASPTSKPSCSLRRGPTPLRFVPSSPPSCLFLYLTTNKMPKIQHLCAAAAGPWTGVGTTQPPPPLRMAVARNGAPSGCTGSAALSSRRRRSRSCPAPEEAAFCFYGYLLTRRKLTSACSRRRISQATW